MQNRAARIITRSSYEIRSSVLLQQLGWKTVEDRWKINKATLMYKVSHNLAPSYLTEKFIKRNYEQDHYTRGRNIIFSVSKPNTNFLKFSIAYNGAVAWNSIPTNIQNCNKLSIFKGKIITS